MNRCRECGSERIAQGVEVARGSGAPADGLLAHLRAAVCADCGRVTLRADNAVELYLAHGGALVREAASAAAAATPAANIQCPSCGSVLSAAATTCEVCGWRAQ